MEEKEEVVEMEEEEEGEREEEEKGFYGGGKGKIKFIFFVHVYKIIAGVVQFVMLGELKEAALGE